MYRKILYSCAMLVYMGSAVAQTTTITVTGGAVMSVKGVAVTLAGNLFDSGSIINDDGSTWYFRGSNQVIGGSNAVTFGNIDFDFNGTLQALNSININGNASFKKGVVNIGGNTMFFGPVATSTAVEASYVTGVVQKKGVTDFTYPYGYNGRGKRVRISNITNGNSNTIFTVFYYRTPPPNAKDVSPELYELNTLDYYDIKPLGSETAMLEFEVDTADYPQSVQPNTDALRLAHYTGGLWKSEGGFSTAVFDYGVKSAGNITNFSPFALAAIRPRVLLANKVALTARLQGRNNAVLDWKTKGTDLAGVRASVLQRSSATDSRWQDVAGITASIISGSYTDAGLGKNTYFYRIKVLQADGSELMSNTALVQVLAANPLKVYPTLTHAEVNIVADATVTLKKIEVYNSAGARVQTIIPAGSRHKLDLSGVAGGMYNIRVFTADGGMEVVRIIKY